MFAPSINNNKKNNKMKKTILTTLTALVLLTSCTKEEDLKPVPSPPVVVGPIEPTGPCLDTCGNIIYAHIQPSYQLEEVARMNDVDYLTTKRD